MSHNMVIAFVTHSVQTTPPAKMAFSCLPPIPRLSRFTVLFSLPLLASIACAQSAANPAVSAPPAENTSKAIPSEVVELTPFTITATQDRGYQAQSTLGGSRLRTNLKDVAAPTTALIRLPPLFTDGLPPWFSQFQPVFPHGLSRRSP